MLSKKLNIYYTYILFRRQIKLSGLNVFANGGIGAVRLFGELRHSRSNAALHFCLSRVMRECTFVILQENPVSTQTHNSANTKCSGGAGSSTRCTYHCILVAPLPSRTRFTLLKRTRDSSSLFNTYKHKQGRPFLSSSTHTALHPHRHRAISRFLVDAPLTARPVPNRPLPKENKAIIAHPHTRHKEEPYSLLRLSTIWNHNTCFPQPKKETPSHFPEMGSPFVQR